MAKRAVIQSMGHSVPEKVLTNADLERMVDTSDEWIRQRTGIVERRICNECETAGTLSIAAAQEALERAEMSPLDLDLVICATVCSDEPFPATASVVQDAIGARNAGAFDLAAACAGFIYGVSVADAMIRMEQCKNVLVVGVDTLTKFVDWTDRSTCVLFGDGAGAALMSGVEGTDRGVMNTVLLSDGSGAKHINLQVGGSKYPFNSARAEGKRSKIYMSGAEVFRFAVIAMGDACCKVLEKSGLTAEDIDLFVPHQANLRIIDAAAKRLNLPSERVFVNVQKYGNTSAGSIPIALYEAEQQGKLKPGMIVMTVGFGAGLVWGANIIKW